MAPPKNSGPAGPGPPQAGPVQRLPQPGLSQRQQHRAAMWAGAVPLAMLGLAIGYLAGDDIVFPLTMALYFALGALGGLWIPLPTMPPVMQDIGKVLPSNGLAQLGWRIAGGDHAAGQRIARPAAGGPGGGCSGRRQRGRRPVVRMARPAATLAFAGRAER